MNKRMKKEWVTALRSGDYRQCRSQLCNPAGEMCCLGVLYDATVDGEWVKRLHGNIPRGWAIPVGDVRSVDTYDAMEGHIRFSDLPTSLLHKAGLNRDIEATLISMNDSQQRNFAYIADWIEENL